MNKLTKTMVLAKKTAEAGVDFSPKSGAICPGCDTKTKIYKTMPWEENTRIRYHRCTNPRCIIAVLKNTVKSIEVDSI